MAKKGGATPQGPQFQSYPQMNNYMMSSMGGAIGGRGLGYGNVGIPNIGTPPSGKGGMGNNTGQSRMPERAPMPSLMDQYSSLNRGVMPFQPLGIRGYSPQSYPMFQPTYDPFDRGSYYRPRQDTTYIQPPIQPPVQPPIMPPINFPFSQPPANPLNAVDSFGVPIFGGRGDLNSYRETPRFPPFQRDNRIRIHDSPPPPPLVRFRPPMPPSREQLPLKQLPVNDSMQQETNAEQELQQFMAQQSIQPMGGLQPLMSSSPLPIRGLTADTATYQQPLPFTSIEQQRPAPIQEPVIQPFGIGISEQTIEDNPVLARRRREREMARRGGSVPMSMGDMARGGLVKFQEGGPVDGGMKLEQEVIAAVMGQHPNPDEVFKRYIDTYGEEGLMELLMAIEQMIPNNGRMVDGAGDGLSDSIPATIDGQQQALLSKDEYVIPADVVAHAGNGSSEAGGQKFDQLVSKVRKDRIGNTQQPKAVELEQVAQEVMV